MYGRKIDRKHQFIEDSFLENDNAVGPLLFSTKKCKTKACQANPASDILQFFFIFTSGQKRFEALQLVLS